MKSILPKWKERLSRIVLFIGLSFLIFFAAAVAQYFVPIYAYFFFQPVVSAGYIKDKGVFRDTRGHGYRIRILYSYQAKGKSYESKRIDFDYGTVFRDKAAAEAKVSAYKIGQKVDVFYDRRFVNIAVLSREYDDKVVLAPFFSILLAIIFLVIFFVINKKYDA